MYLFGCSTSEDGARVEGGRVIVTAPDAQIALDAVVRVAPCRGGSPCEVAGEPTVGLQAFDDGARWKRLSFRIDNRSDETQWALSFDGQADHLVLVSPRDGDTVRSGHLVPVAERRLPAVRYALPIDLAPHDETEVVVDAELAPFEGVPIRLTSRRRQRHDYLVGSTLTLLALGGMLFLAIQAAFIFAWTRDRPYLWYAAYALCGFCVWSLHFGPGGLVLADGLFIHQLTGTFFKLLVVFVLVFTMSFLGLTKQPRARRFLVGVVVAATIMCVLDYVTTRRVLKPYSAVAGALGLAVTLYLTVRALARGQREARFLAAGWLPATVITVLAIAGFVLGRGMWISRRTVFFLHAWEFVCSAFALADRIRITQLAKERAEAEARLQRSAATTDALTGVGNRAAFDAFADELQTREDTPTTLVVLDVDGLKAVNDSRGHATGDAMLKALADGMSKRLRDEDRFFRLGGDEFVIAVRAGAEGGPIMMARLEEAVDEVRAQGFPRFGLSAGYCALSETDHDVMAAFARADERMYEAKQQHHSDAPRVSSMPPQR